MITLMLIITCIKFMCTLYTSPTIVGMDEKAKQKKTDDDDDQEVEVLVQCRGHYDNERR